MIAEILLGADAAAAGDHDPRRGELRPVGGRDLVLDPGREPGIAGGGGGLDRRRGLLAGRLEAGAAHGDDLLGVGRLHRLDRVAGIDRPLEGVGAEHAGDLGDHHDVEQRREPRRDVLAGGGAGKDDMVVAVRHALALARSAARPSGGRRPRPRHGSPWRRPRASPPPRPPPGSSRRRPAGGCRRPSPWPR